MTRKTERNETAVPLNNGVIDECHAQTGGAVAREIRASASRIRLDDSPRDSASLFLRQHALTDGPLNWQRDKVFKK
jgi:hypothetical protein